MTEGGAPPLAVKGSCSQTPDFAPLSDHLHPGEHSDNVLTTFTALEIKLKRLNRCHIYLIVASGTILAPRHFMFQFHIAT